VEIKIDRVVQLGPALAGQAAAVEVRVRNVGKTDCGACQVRVMGRGAVIIQAVPLLRGGAAAHVAVSGLVFPRPGKVLLSVAVEGPRDQVEFAGRKPGTTFELTVLEGGPLKRGGGR
jgi:hypothetical protein